MEAIPGRPTGPDSSSALSVHPVRHGGHHPEAVISSPVAAGAIGASAASAAHLASGGGVGVEFGPEGQAVSGAEVGVGAPSSSSLSITRKFSKKFEQDITVPTGTMTKVETLFKQVKVLLVQKGAFGNTPTTGTLEDREINHYKISIDLEKRVLRYHTDGSTTVHTVDLTNLLKSDGSKMFPEGHQIYTLMNDLEKSIGKHTTRGEHDMLAGAPSVSHYKGGVHAFGSDSLKRISMEDYVTKHMPKMGLNGANPREAIKRISKMRTYCESIERFFDGKINDLKEQIKQLKKEDKDFSKEEAELRKLEERLAVIQGADMYAVQTVLAHSDEKIALGDGSPRETTVGVIVADRTDTLDRLDVVAERVRGDLETVARVGKRLGGLLDDRALTEEEIEHSHNVALLAAPTRLAQCAYMDRHGLSADRHMFVERALLEAVADPGGNANFDILVSDLEIQDLDLVEGLQHALTDAEGHIEARAKAIDDKAPAGPPFVKETYKVCMKAHVDTKDPREASSGVAIAAGATIDGDPLPGTGTPTVPLSAPPTPTVSRPRAGSSGSDDSDVSELP
jgi:hypothetical protein